MPGCSIPDRVPRSNLVLAAAVLALGVSFAQGALAEQPKTTAPAIGCKTAAERGRPAYVAPVKPSTAVAAGAYTPDPGREKLVQGGPQVAAVTVRGYDPHQMKQISAGPKCRPAGGKP